MSFDFLYSEEQLALREEIRDFVKWVPKKIILDMDADIIKFPKDLIREAGRRNLLGCKLPREWGGRGMDWVGQCMVSEEFGTLGYQIGCTCGVGPDIVAGAILIHGTDEQKQKYVKPLLRGDIFAAECLTEPNGGSDVFGASTVALDKGDHFLLSGQKRFIIGGEGADFFVVYALTDLRPEAKPQQALTCLIVDRGYGVETKYLYSMVGCRGGGSARIAFKDVVVPKANVLGKVNGAHNVMSSMMISERLGAAAMTLGSSRVALDLATHYTSRRKAFGKTLNRFQGVSFQMAEAVTLIDAARSIIYTAARAVDTPSVSASQVRRMISEAKKFATEACQKIVYISMQVVGGIGYTNVLPLERIFRDVRHSTISAGTSEIMAMIIGSEWYQEKRLTSEKQARNFEEDALEYGTAEEIVYE